MAENAAACFLVSAFRNLAGYNFADSSQTKFAAFDVTLYLFAMFWPRTFCDHNNGSQITGRLARLDHAGDLVEIEWNFGNQNNIGATSNAAVQSDPAGVASHYFYNHDPPVTGRCSMHPIERVHYDLEATATTFGFDSAVAVVMDALDRVHTTATSHRRVMVVEVMGRHAGWIALHGGIAGGADIILIPEIPFDFDKIASVVKAREAAGYLGTVVVVAEGARPKHGEQVKRDVQGGEFRLGGIGEIVAREIAKRTDEETRCCVLGHLQRGGAPTTLDRILGTRFGVKAVQLANEGHFGSMVSYQNYQVRHVPIADAVNRLRLVPPNGEMVQTARDVEISFGD